MNTKALFVIIQVLGNFLEDSNVSYPLTFLHQYTDFYFLQFFLLSGAWTLDLTNQLGLQLPLQVCIFLIIFLFVAEDGAQKGSFRNDFHY